jgi:transcriptional regulator with XRE-family HTH domain
VHTMTPAERAVLRIREEMAARNISQRDLADRLNCSQGRIAKMLNGNVELRLNDAEELAHAVGLTLVEVIRDRGLEFYAEMTPTEVRMLERLRQRPSAMQGVLYILELRTDATPLVVGSKKKAGRPQNSAKERIQQN